MDTTQDISALTGETLHDNEGAKIGEITDVILVDESGAPEWIGVKIGGLLGSKLRFVPVQSIGSQDDELRVAYDKDHVKDGPDIEDNDEVTEQEATRLYEHFSASEQADEGTPEDSA
jgi:sporulation protein YlmC with PRC-barrel domain